MAIRAHYLDTSAIVKLFLSEEGSDVLRKYYSGQSVFYTTSLCFAETLGVIKAKNVREEISYNKYLNMCHRFMLDVTNEKIKIDEISITSHPTNHYVEKYAKDYELDIADAFQLYTIKEGFLKILGGDSKTILITADEGLAEAARKEGLRVWNCLKDSPP